MELDKTRIAIRERGLLEVFDISLHVTRIYAWPLLLTTAIGAVPLTLLNYLLIGWLAEQDYVAEFPGRYVWLTILLVYIESHVGTIFATYFLGQAVFVERPSFRQVLIDVIKLLPRIVWCQVILRGVLAAVLISFAIERYGEFSPGIEIFLLPVLAAYVSVMRAVRPYINEIVLLERNPLRAKSAAAMTVGRRSKLLHNPAAGDLFGRAMVSWLFGIALGLAFYGSCQFLSGIFLNNWQQGQFMFLVCLPLSLWLLALYFTVVRFMSYLDLRIRQEGWEVELKLRAEAAHLTSKLT